MENIRAFQDADLPAVQALMEARLPGWTWGESFLAETVIDHPWADPEVPSLVALGEQGEIVGFVGAQVRRMRLDGRTLRGVCCSHLVVVADRRAGVAGMFLLRQLFSGPQEVSWTDTATDDVVRMWRALGGHLDYSRSLDWMLVLRPLGWARALGTAVARDRDRAGGLLPVGALPVQVARPWRVRRGLPPVPSGVGGERATAATIVEHLPALTRNLRLRLDYDQAHLEAVFAQVESALGPVVSRLVRRRGNPIGWYAYVRQRHGMSRVLHLCALEAETDAVVAELVEHATASRTTVLTGRTEPQLYRSLRRRRAVLAFARQPVVHTRDPEIRDLLMTRSALLTQLDGEWFVEH